MAELGKVPPNDIEAEKAVLGACLLSNDAILDIVEILPNAGMFFDRKHKDIYDAILELIKDGVPIDIITVSKILKDKNLLDKCGGNEYLILLTDNPISLGHAKHYAKIVKEKAVLRRLITAGSSIINMAFNYGGDEGEKNINSLVDKAESFILKVGEYKNLQDTKPVSSIVEQVYNKVLALHQSGETTQGILTGLTKVDSVTTGFQKSDLVIIAGRPAMGKTSFALNILINACVKKGKRGLMFSVEMSEEQLVQRLISIISGINLYKIRTGKLNESDLARFQRAVNRLYNANILIDDNPNLTILELRSKARREHKKQKLDFILVDYLQLVYSSYKGESRNLEVADITRQLKGLAKELDVPVLCLSQLSRRVEERADKRPLLSDLRDSGAIEQDADLVLFLYRPAYYKRDSEDITTEVIIAKHRNGAVGTVKVGFIKECTRFVNLEEPEGGGFGHESDWV